MNEEANQSADIQLGIWNPREQVKLVSAHAVAYSRGFLCSRPEQWFPSLNNQWLLLLHSMGIEASIIEVTPLLEYSTESDLSFVASVDDELIGIFCNRESAHIITSAFSPDSSDQGRDILLEYLARRFITSASLSWSGPDTSVIRFEPMLNAAAVRGVGAVKITAVINGQQAMFWMVIGKQMVERLDGLWRRQLQSTVEARDAAMDVRLELTHINIPKAMIDDYLMSGTIVDLEVPVSDTVTLMAGTSPWVQGRLIQCDEHFGFEVMSESASSAGAPPETASLAVELGTVRLDPQMLIEVAQLGAMVQTTLPLGDQVILSIDGQQVGTATLRSYQGRFALLVS